MHFNSAEMGVKERRKADGGGDEDQWRQREAGCKTPPPGRQKVSQFLFLSWVDKVGRRRRSWSLVLKRVDYVIGAAFQAYSGTNLMQSQVKVWIMLGIHRQGTWRCLCKGYPGYPSQFRVSIPRCLRLASYLPTNNCITSGQRCSNSELSWCEAAILATCPKLYSAMGISLRVDWWYNRYRWCTTV